MFSSGLYEASLLFREEQEMEMKRFILYIRRSHLPFSYTEYKIISYSSSPSVYFAGTAAKMCKIKMNGQQHVQVLQLSICCHGARAFDLLTPSVSAAELLIL